MASMILVNTAGNYATTYWPLKHAEWNGWTPTDLIFPSFLFMMGVAMTLSFPARFARGATVPTLVRHIVIRSLGLFAIGLFVNAYPEFVLHTWRIPGCCNASLRATWLSACCTSLLAGRLRFALIYRRSRRLQFCAWSPIGRL